MSELKPCPFCGDEVEVIKDYTADVSDWIRHKTKPCAIQFDNFSSGEDVAALWNRRADTDRQGERLYTREELLSDESLEIGRKAIEDVLIEWRDERRSELRGNGLVIRERDGTESSIIRFGPETALYIGIRAMIDALLGEDKT